MTNRFFIFLMVLFLSVSSVFSQEKNQILITEEFSNESLEQVLTKIQTKYGLKIFYNPEWVQGSAVSESVNEKSVLEFLTPLLASFNMKIEAYDQSNFVIFTDENFKSNVVSTENPKSTDAVLQIGNTSAQSGDIAILSGYVKDGKNGETIIGATIYSLENEKGAITNDQGYFTLEIPTGVQRIRISFIGFADEVRQIRLGSRKMSPAGTTSHAGSG